MTEDVILALVVIAPISAAISWAIASGRGDEAPTRWALWGLILGPIGILLTVAWSGRQT